MRNFIIKIIFFSSLMISITACNSNLFVSGESSGLLDDMETDIAYITDNCEQVIANLENDAAIDKLTAFEKYQYVTSELACSGFDISRALSETISTNPDLQPLDIMYPLIGIKQYTTIGITNLFDTYDKIMFQCLDRMDDKLQVVCTLSATVINTISVTKTVMQLLEVSKLNANFAMMQEQLKGKNPLGATLTIYPSLSFNDPNFEARLVTSSEFINNNSVAIQGILELNSNAALFTIFDDLTDDFLNGSNSAQGLALMIDELFRIK